MAQKHTLMEDIHTASEWAAGNLSKTGYRADYSLESIREIERWIQENPQLFEGNSGSIIFAIGSYVGETMNRVYHGSWKTDDSDPQGELNSQVQIGTSIFWPVQSVMNRNRDGEENNLYDYVCAADPNAKSMSAGSFLDRFRRKK